MKNLKDYFKKEHLSEAEDTSGQKDADGFFINIEDIQKWILDNATVSAKAVRPNKKTGLIDIVGTVTISPSTTEIEQLPVKFGTVTGHFHANIIGLRSLKGAPRIVKKDFNVAMNALTSLEGGPDSVGGAYNANENDLTSLKGLPESYTGKLAIGYQRNKSLKNLVGCPPKLKSLQARDCGLMSLEGGPTHIITEYDVRSNDLTSLNGAPTNCAGADMEFSQNRRLNDFRGIANICSQANTLILNTAITEELSKTLLGGLGFIFFMGSTNKLSWPQFVAADQSDAARAFRIIRKYAGRPDDMFDCQEEMIAAGLDAERFSQL